MSWGAWVRGWRASRLTSAGKGSLPVPVRTPVRVNAGPPGRSTPPATLVGFPRLRPRPCGAIDRLTGAVCTQPQDHPAVVERDPTTGRVRRWDGWHVDLSDPSSPVAWPDDEHTLHRREEASA